MICDEYNFIRIHIKKCGGRSFAALFPNLSDTHQILAFYQLSYPDKYSKYYKWTIVRNPWERLVSLYFYLLQELGFQKKSSFVTFERFVSDLYFANQPCSTIDISKYAYESNPQIDYLKNIEGKVDLDFICYLSNIKEDFEQIKQILNFPSSWIYPHFGKSIHDDYRTYYNDFTINCVSLLYSEEIEYFGFDFEDINKFDYAKRNST